MTIVESATDAINTIGAYIAKSSVARLEKQVLEESIKRDRDINEYLRKNPDDINGVREKFVITPIEETPNDWYVHEMM